MRSLDLRPWFRQARQVHQLVLVGAYTGLWPGEILGLKVKRLNLVAGAARVAEALTADA